jgi:TonB family protein
MSSYVSTWKKPEQFELYVKKFRSLFDMHNIGCGSPEDFPGFMQKLIQDRHFAMDFWALTGTLSKREGGELSVEEMLAVIVDSVIGGEVPAGDDGIKTLVDELGTLLSGVDLYSPSRFNDVDETDEVKKPPPPEAPQSHTVSQTRFTDMTERAAGKVPVAAPTNRAPAFTANTVESVSIQSSSIAAVQHHLDEALMRLELKELELKEHLEDLDKKMSRIEPHLEALSSKVDSAERLRSSVQEPVDSSFERAVRKPAGNSRLVLEPKPESFSDKPDGPPIPTPLSGYSQPSSHRSAVVFVVLFLLVIAGGFVLQQKYGSALWQSYGVDLKERYNALLDKVHSSDTKQVATNSASPNATPSTVTEANQTAAAASDAGSPVNPPTPSAPTTPLASTAVPYSTPESTVTPHPSAPVTDEPKTVSPLSNPRSSRRTTHTAVDEPVETAPTQAEASAVKVAPSVMEANLVASRVPAYPEGAKANHIEGPVLVQAFISKDGFVDRVHVIEGNPRLRNAAAEAVQKWRFKPYLLNGKPVEVATTITVDFKLDDW